MINIIAQAASGSSTSSGLQMGTEGWVLVAVGIVCLLLWCPPRLILVLMSNRFLFARSMLEKGESSGTRNGPQGPIASAILVIGGMVLAALSVRFLVYGGPEEYKDYLTAVLPLIGTWVGTVLAFYFGERNFNAAANAAAKVARAERERDNSLSVKEKMIGVDKIAPVVAKTDDKGEFDLGTVTLQAIRDLMKEKRIFRVPVMDGSKRVSCVVHSDPLNEYLLVNERAGESKKAEPTLSDLLSHEIGKGRILGKLAFVPETATMGEAKAAMQATVGCQDVFVTKSGGTKDPIIGWLTNNEIQRFAE